ncbi:MAG: LLM class flavin-dependent oxidoreductase [Acidimicrobiia bacterium]|nr:LLM class flavin-dependent oxidoreductase [Acidimicrobiia bacterium]
MKWGLAIPQVFPDGPVDMGLVRASIGTAEAAGCDGLWVLESGVRPRRTPVELEPLSLLSYAAALTSRVRLGTSIILSGLRNPIWLAKQLAALDHLCGGRLTVGVGLGDRGRAEIMGIPREEWTARFAEGIGVMRSLWAEGTATFSGQFSSYEDVSMMPKPVQHPLPIWFGAHKPAALRRAARLGDGWMGAGASSHEDFVKQVPQLRSYLEEAERDIDEFPISKRVYIAVDKDAGRAESRVRGFFDAFYANSDLGSRCALWGSPAQCADGLAALRDAGAGMVMLHPMFDPLDQLAALSESVVPQLG